MSSSRKYLSGSEKRKRKRDSEEKNKKLPKISQYFKNDDFIDEKASEQCSESEELDVTKRNSMADAAPDASGYPDPEQPQQGTSKNQSESYFSVNNIASSPYITDKGNFKELNDQVKRFVIENGHCKPKGPFLKDSDNRSFLEKHYYIVSKSGVKLERTWLSYSLILQKAYCEPCWLFANRASKKIQNVWIEGYNDWKHIVDAIERHETSKIHLDSCLTYQQWRLHGTLDEEQESMIKKEKSFWRQVLSRLLDVTLTLSTCNLAFRGHREKADSNDPSSRGNVLSIVELLAKYDPILQELLSKPKGQIKYLSPKIQNELISVLVLKVENALINEINAAPFYSIIFDTTQDISKTDQMCELYRYCIIEKDENGIPKALVIKESFLGFHEVKDQTALAMSNQIIKSINDKNIPLNKCRGQGYDGANTMKGTYGGVQKLIKDIEPNAVFVHCAAHNLNLVLNDAVREVIDMQHFFETVQQIYNFFGHSIKRWNILSSFISDRERESSTSITLKTLNPTRWAGCYNAIFALKVRFVEVQKALTKTILLNCKSDERNEAISLKKKIENYKFIMLLVFHCKILQTIDSASKALQSKATDLTNALKRLKICLEELERYRHEFENLKKEANSVAEKWSINPEFSKTRQRKVKRHFDELCEDERLQDPESLFKVNIFYRVLDIIINQLKSRFLPMNEIVSNFSVLQPATLQNLNDTDLLKKALEFVEIYKKDISESFAREILSFRSTFRDEIEKSSCIRELADLLIIKNHFMSCSFPEVCTALMLFVTIPVTTASAERSFSKLKLIKTYLRNSMGQDRLRNLAILSIENSMARSLNFDDVIDTFAEQKARKKEFY
jgi:hypothetical protein